MRSLTILGIGLILLSAGCSSRQLAWDKYTIGQESIARAEWSNAETLLRRAIKYDPTLPGVNVDLAIVLLQDGRKEEALKLLEVERRLFPESHHFVELLKRSIEEGKVVKPPVAPRNKPAEEPEE